MKIVITPFKIALLSCLLSTILRAVFIITQLPTDLSIFTMKEKIFFFRRIRSFYNPLVAFNNFYHTNDATYFNKYSKCKRSSKFMEKLYY